MTHYLPAILTFIFVMLSYTKSYGEVRTPYDLTVQQPEKVVVRNVCGGHTINWTIPNHTSSVSLLYRDKDGNTVFSRTFSVTPNYSIHLRATK